MIQLYINTFYVLFLKYSLIIAIPRPIRNVLGLSVSFILSLMLSCFHMSLLDKIPTIEQDFYFILLTQGMQSVFFGLFISLILEFIPILCRMIDTLRGNQLSEQFAPELGPRDSQLEMYSALMIPMLFFKGPYFLKLLELIIDTPTISRVNNFDITYFNLIIKNGLSFILIIVFPIIMIYMILELMNVALSKLLPKLNIGFELGMLKACLGVFGLMLYLNSSDKFIYLFDKSYDGLINNFSKLLGS